jgi:hypothetical protein
MNMMHVLEEVYKWDFRGLAKFFSAKKRCWRLPGTVQDSAGEVATFWRGF